MPRALRTLSAYCILLALLCAALPAPAPARGAPADEPRRYIVRLGAAPLPTTGIGPAQAAQHNAALDAALNAITASAGAASAPAFTYRHAISGFALDLTPAQAARIAALPGVVAVQPERFAELLSDTSPNLLGVAQTDLSPALFHTRLAGGPAGSGGRAVAHYDDTTGQLSLQLFYHGLSAAPTVAELRDPSGARLRDLAPLAVGAPGPAGGYIGALELPTVARVALLAGALELRLAAPGGALSGALAPSRGEGVLVGVIDSGIDPTSPSFQDPTPDGYAFSNPRGSGFLGVCDPTSSRYDPSFPCNNKLIGAYTFDATAASFDPQGQPSPRDNHGHGSHTAGTAVGNYVAAIRVGLAELGPLTGIAPRASLVVYDACGVPGNDLSCPQSALLAALDQAIADGVAVINYSIGAGASDPWAELEALGMLSAVERGIFVAAAAGNRGPGPGGISSPANAPWVTAVAAGVHGRRFISSLAELDGGEPALRPEAPLFGAGFAPPLAQAPIRHAAELGNPECARFDEAQQAQLAGVIVACGPGAVGRFDQAYNVRDAGAAGVVMLNSAADGDRLDDLEVYPLPAAQLSHADGQRLSAWLAGCADCRASLSGTRPRREPAAAEQIMVTSSRGPNSLAPGVLKPNLAAPGQVILAPISDRDPLQPDYLLSSGTSMAAPHIAGLAALLRQIHPDWSPAELSSALMLTAAPMRLDDGTPAGPFDQGAGRAQGAAAFAGFVLPEQPAAFAAADPARGGDPAQLNLAGLTSERCERSCSFRRTLRSTLEVPVTYAISLSDGAGFSLATAPAGQLTLAPGASATLVVTATVTGAATGSYSYGAVSLRAHDGLAPLATLPVALKTAGVSLPAEVAIAARERSGSLALLLRSEAISRLEARAYGLAPLLSERHELMRGGSFERELSLPADSLLLRVQVDQTSAPAPELVVYVDRDGDGLLQVGEVLCAAGPELRCELGAAELAGDLAEARSLRLRVSSGAAAGPGRDSFRLSYGLVRTTPPATPSLGVSGPAGVAAGEPFALDLAWQLPEARFGKRYLGLLSLSDAGDGTMDARDLGTAVITLEFVGQRGYLPLVAR